MAWPRGVTIVELIAALAIIAVLVSLTLIAVQSAREAARKSICSNRLRQIGIASQNFVTSHSHFPSNGWGFGWIGQLDRGVGSNQPGGWAFQTLPFMEIHLPAPESGTGIYTRAHWLKTPMPQFRCPSRPAVAIGPHSKLFSPINTYKVEMAAKTDFAICEGDRITGTLFGPLSLEEGDSQRYQWTNTKIATGVSFQRSTIRPRDITDGLSHTYLVGEKHVNAEHYDDALDLGYDQSLLSGVDLDLNRWTISPPINDRQPSANSREFGSAHATTWNVVNCDGSTQAVSFSIDARVHTSHGNRLDAGG